MFLPGCLCSHRSLSESDLGRDIPKCTLRIPSENSIVFPQEWLNFRSARRPVVSVFRREAGVSVPGHALRCGPETSVTSPLRYCFGYRTRRRSVGNVGIPKGFPRGVGRVESRLLGFPCFPLLGISNACLPHLGARNFVSVEMKRFLGSYLVGKKNISRDSGPI